MKNFSFYLIALIVATITFISLLLAVVDSPANAEEFVQPDEYCWYEYTHVCSYYPWCIDTLEAYYWFERLCCEGTGCRAWEFRHIGSCCTHASPPE